jgi:hypothetical protein
MAGALRQICVLDAVFAIDRVNDETLLPRKNADIDRCNIPVQLAFADIARALAAVAWAQVPQI